MQQFIKILLSFFLNEAQHVSGAYIAHHQEPKTAPAASGLHTWKVVERAVVGHFRVA
jgi:hypothetical protein